MKDLEKRGLLNTSPVSVSQESVTGSGTHLLPQGYYSLNGHEELPPGMMGGGTPGGDTPGNGTLKRQESLYQNGVALSWRGINVSTMAEKKGCLPCLRRKPLAPAKQILKGVSGVVKPGTFLVVMGASGSGKTTLLNVLTRRNQGSLVVEGEVLVNGRNIGEEINSISSYIQQDDLFIGSMTVKEHLWFNAVLRMGQNFSDEQRHSAITEVIQDMGLKKCEDTLIGIPGMTKGLSGGEKKRLAFASEMLTRPSALFCDEPTSGLDSYMAQSVVESLISLARKGRTVLCTIHQPSSQVFAMFEQILIMAEGKTAYMGPTSDMPEFFKDLGYDCPTSFNPADYYIQSLAIVPGREKECREGVALVAECFRESSYARSINWQLENESYGDSDKFVLEMEKIDGNLNKAKPSAEDAKLQKYKSTWITQFLMCFWRSTLDVKRNMRVLPARVLQLQIMALFLGTLYYQQDYNMTGVSNIDGAMFILIIQVSLNTAFTVATAFAREFPVFMKEHKDTQYRVSAYYLGKILIDLPVILVGASLYTTISYWMIGLYPDVECFFTALAALVLISLTSVASGHLASALFPNPQLALTFLPFTLGITLLFSGFLIKDSSVMSVFKPIEVLSSFRYCYEILLVNQWRKVTSLDCEFTEQANSLREQLNVTTDYVSNDHVQSSNWCYPNGVAIIYSYQYQPDEIPGCFAIMAALFVSTELLAFTSLWLKARRK